MPPAERSPLPRLYNRAVDSIAGISRMGREDRVWLWLIGQNSNLEALGLSGAQDRANFSIVAVGLGDNQITIELALSNSTMFTRGQALKNALKEHQGKPYQIAACTRKPANLLIMPSSYKDNAQEDFSPEILARLGAPSSTPIAPLPSVGPYAEDIAGTWREDFAKSLPANLSESEFKQRYELEKMLRESSSLEPVATWDGGTVDDIDPAIELINAEPIAAKRDALMIAYLWAQTKISKGEEVSRSAFLERARKERKNEYLVTNRDEVWDDLQALID